MLLLVGEQLSGSDIISCCYKKNPKQTKQKKPLWNYYNWKKILEKPISHLFSIHSLYTFDSTFGIVIFTYFSKLVSFLFSEKKKKKNVHQALVAFISFFLTDHISHSWHLH